METILRGWPWLGLVLAIGMLAVMLGRPRPDGWRARFDDPGWLLWLPLPIYMLHQFEEHGVDLLGRAYPFQGFLCSTIGWTGSLADCPASEWFLFAVNPGAVWIAGVAAGIYGPKRALVGAATLGIPAINALLHIVPAIRTQTYNPGVATSVLLFLPMCAWIYRKLVAHKLLTWRRVGAAIAAGWLMHAVLMGSLVAFMHGLIVEPVLLVTQVLNGCLPIAVGHAVPPLPRQS